MKKSFSFSRSFVIRDLNEIVFAACITFAEGGKKNEKRKEGRKRKERKKKTERQKEKRKKKGKKERKRKKDELAAFVISHACAAY